MKLAVFVTAILATALAMAAPAGAADLGRPLPMKAPPPAAPFYDWSGFYVGLNAGYGWGDSHWTTLSVPYNTSGGLIGGTIGYNWQTPSRIVLGVEGDIDWTDINGGGGCVLVGPCRTNNNWLGTVRGRAGFALDRFMPYVTGGAAFGDIKGTTPFGSATSTQAGWALGGGLEVGLSRNWSVKVEYLHVDLGSFTCAVCTPAPSSVNFNADIVRGGVNVRF
jgi:outer membrane immunogenic protein